MNSKSSKLIKGLVFETRFLSAGQLCAPRVKLELLDKERILYLVFPAFCCLLFVFRNTVPTVLRGLLLRSQATCWKAHYSQSVFLLLVKFGIKTLETFLGAFDVRLQSRKALRHSYLAFK